MNYQNDPWYYGEWEEFFLWFPEFIDGKRYWLTTVWRRNTGEYGGVYEYKLLSDWHPDEIL